jgi:glycosyltransferase involved in cell wall biosynthesis
VTVEHVDAGPPEPIPKDELLPHMSEFAGRLERAWRAERPEVVHAHFWMSGLASLVAARPLGIPVVQTFHALGAVKRRHQGDRDTSPPQRLAAEDALIRDCDAIIATCSAELFELVRLGADARRIAVIPCGVDLGLFRPEGRSHPPRRGGLNRVVMVSRLVERKGIGDVIEALTRLPRTELLVAGGPATGQLGGDPEAARCLRLARALGAASRVHFLGGVEHGLVPPLLRSADVVACAPWYEPFGMVALEAMACGVPVVATAVGGLVNTVVDEVTGYHVPARSPQDLAGAIGRLLNDPETRRRMGSAGVERAERRYGWDTVGDATLSVYAAMVDGAAVTEVGR